jgi:hypothetical protein
MPWKLFKLFLSFIRTAVDHPLLKEKKNTHTNRRSMAHMI